MSTGYIRSQREMCEVEEEGKPWLQHRIIEAMKELASILTTPE